MKLNKERIKLDKLIANKTVTLKDRDRFSKRIVTINERMRDIYDQEKQRAEKRAIENIQGDVKAFYNYANSFRKSKVKVGPLKSGTTYQSGEKEMAEILSRQYESVFTTPKEETYKFKDVELTPGRSFNDVHAINLSDIEAVEFEICETDGNDGLTWNEVQICEVGVLYVFS